MCETNIPTSNKIEKYRANMLKRSHFYVSYVVRIAKQAFIG